MQLIGSRTRQDLNLSIAAAHFGVNGGKYDAELADHIRMYLSRRTHTIRITAVLDAQPVSDRIDHSRADAGKRRGFAESGATDAGHGLHQVEYVVARQRKVAHLSFRKDLSDRW